VSEPSLQFINWVATHRLVNSKYSPTGTVLSAIADNTADLANLTLLDGATNDRIQAEQGKLPGITNYELVYGIPNSEIVRAAFAHPGPFGGRFNDHTRGAWYASKDLECCVAEVAYHRSRNLADIVVPTSPYGRPATDQATYDDWLADFRAEFHILDPAAEFSEYLQPEPVPQCYSKSQELARSLLNQQSNGILYPSVRHPGSQCIACFRPPLVYSPRRSERLAIMLKANKTGYDRAYRMLTM
jgi:RES domain-containing protein